MRVQRLLLGALLLGATLSVRPAIAQTAGEGTAPTGTGTTATPGTAATPGAATPATTPTPEASAPVNAPAADTSTPANAPANTTAPSNTSAEPNTPTQVTEQNAGTTNTPTADPNAAVQTFSVPELADTVQGTVVRANPAQGEVVVENDDGEFAVSGLPQQIASIQPGATVDLPFENISGYYWLPLPGGRPPEQPATQIVVGDVREVDAARGTLTLGRLTLRAHPDMLAAFVPGQTVAVAFETVNNVNWLRRIRRNVG